MSVHEGLPAGFFMGTFRCTLKVRNGRYTRYVEGKDAGLMGKHWCPWGDYYVIGETIKRFGTESPDYNHLKMTIYWDHYKRTGEKYEAVDNVYISGNPG